MASVPPEGWLVPGPPQLLEGSDHFSAGDATVLDFWRWAFSDLRDNVTHGVLAEFLVALALRRASERRVPWDNYDLVTGEGARVEVKASGYLQNWAQAKHSALSFGRVAARSWDANTNSFGAQPEVRADIFVFAVQTCTDNAAYDALEVSQREFYVVAADAVRSSGYKTLGINWVRKQAQAVRFAGLNEAVRKVAGSLGHSNLSRTRRAGRCICAASCCTNAVGAASDAPDLCGYELRGGCSPRGSVRHPRTR